MGDKIQTNEEIIEELTSDLESCCVKEQAKDVQEDCTGELLLEKEENAETVEEKLPDDFIDEESLKDRELDLSEEDKEKLRIEAEQIKNEGNSLFKDGEYHKAMETYTQGIMTCPLAFDKDRAILYANRAAAKSKYLAKEEKDSAIQDCTKAIELNPDYVKAYIRRAQLYDETDKFHEALEDYKKILTFDAGHAEANAAVRRLPPLIEEKNEQLKAEMLGKLKDLGNMILRPFGLSTNNFELEKDSGSGGYSVKFNQSPT